MKAPHARPSLRVVRPGMLSSVQDLGRGTAGVGAIGVPAGGAADAWSLRVGNRLVGNPDDAAAIEMTLVGGAFEFTATTDVVVTGGACGVTLRRGPTSRPLAMGEVAAAEPGDVLDAGAMTRGCRAYVCVAGGIVVPLVLASRSTELRAAFGGLDGRALRAGDVLPVGGQPGPERANPSALGQQSWDPCDNSTIRALAVADDAANTAAINALFSSEFSVSSRSDRTGVRLDGPTLPRAGTGRMVSEGMAMGAVQLPPDGRPIVLGVDHPTTGGYPVIAVVASVDTARVGQLRPGARTRFERITRDAAIALYRERQAALARALPLRECDAGGGRA